MKKLLFLSFIFLTIAQYSVANEPETFTNLIFIELDVNKDGVIDKNDLHKFSKNEFQSMDKNKSGSISKEQFFEFVCDKSCKQGNCECKDYNDKENLSYLKEYWDRIDKDASGFLTFEEKLESDLETFFNLDSDGDGKIKREDIEAQMY